MRLRFQDNNDRLSWFWERKLRVERDLFITRGKFYAIGWARAGSRSKYRQYPTFYRPVAPWEHRCDVRRGDDRAVR